MDKFSPKKRSAIMSAVKGKNTTPELRVRKVLHAMGYRFRLHRSDLPGKPDIVLPKYRTCIFVHGCFWHQHPECKRATLPATNHEFWVEKLNKNTSRDKAAFESLMRLGWQVFIIWECQTKNTKDLETLILREIPKTC
jgi:DNA mismatch endonuclease (patch repair protein)